MEKYLVFPGSSALSEFRRRGLAQKLKAESVRARYLHYVALDSLQEPHLLDSAKNVLQELLTYGDEDYVESSENFSQQRLICHVYPRFGTISPWSSKATSIAHVCGLDFVYRIERGMEIEVDFRSDDYDEGLLASVLHDRMTQMLSRGAPNLDSMFGQYDPAPLLTVPLHSSGKDPMEVLRDANRSMGLALDESEMQYLVDAYAPGGNIARDPTDAELFMFSQINSEHCRHKQFNASWTIDGKPKPYSLFGMIRNTHKQNPKYTLSAYSDNAAVFEGSMGTILFPDRNTNEWKQVQETRPFLGKVETHNHPTSVVPFEGAATGSGGEIRDEAAVGRGSRSKAGLCGFAVSNLMMPDLPQPWELQEVGYPGHVATSLEIMRDAPLGSAAFNNEFGRPCLTGFFRTLLTESVSAAGERELRGYHKPIMVAGGLGTVRPQHVLKDPNIVKPGSFIIVMGGPAMLIGLGGGAASSQTSAEESKELDFASVQRGNAEVQRRAQEVIDACTALGADNPILFIHDLGAGGLSNGVTELLHDTNLGATMELRNIDNADRSMSPMQIWCCEAQERFAVAVDSDGISTFTAIAERERCRFSILGKAERRHGTDERVVLTDKEFAGNTPPIDLSLSTLFGNLPRLKRQVDSRKNANVKFDNSMKEYLPKMKNDLLQEAISRVLQLPAVASKMFLITIGDRTVGGLTCRDQLVGPWQTPVADCSVTATSLTPGIRTGEAMAMGEKPTLALINPAASARMAVAESLMNIAAAELKDGLERIRLSANWMTAINAPGEAANIYEAVEAIGMGLCPELGVSIPVGKDSTSMKMGWKDAKTGEAKSVTAPLSLVVTAFAPVSNTRNTWTPALRSPSEDGIGETILLMVDLAEGHRALGGSALAQTFGQIGDEAPDVRDVQLLKDFFDATEQLHEAGIVLAYHDISDGGLITCLSEMAIAGRCGVNVMLDSLCRTTEASEIISSLFSEELGAVFQVRKTDEINFHRCFATCGPPQGLIKKIGQVSRKSSNGSPDLAVYHGADPIFRRPVHLLQQLWASTSHHMCRLRDNPDCADSEHNSISDVRDPGLSYNLTFKVGSDILSLTSRLSTRLSLTSKPRVAILREQGINGQSEMAAAFMNAGFAAIDVHMTDLLSGLSLSTFTGLAACGGFSYGDVLGAGQGWAKSVLLHQKLRQQFAEFFARKDTFALGVCNGCQFLTRLKSLIPGAESWPSFQRNTSEQYEARFCMVEVLDTKPHSPSIFLHGMGGTTMPIALSHGEGRAQFDGASSQAEAAKALLTDHLVSVRYVDNYLAATETYPANPNGSPLGIAGIRSADGRVLAMMPHPERCVLNPGSWLPPQADAWGDFGPWFRIFQSARRWVG